MPDREKVMRALLLCNEADNDTLLCDDCPYQSMDERYRVGYRCWQKVRIDALDLLREQEALTVGVWHKWPDEKPEDYVDSTIPEGEGCWEITCLSLSRNGRVYLQKRSRFINRDPGNCHWSHWPDHGSAGWWMFIPKLPKEGDSE